jgi:hypothetical protein
MFYGDHLNGYPSINRGMVIIRRWLSCSPRFYPFASLKGMLGPWRKGQVRNLGYDCLPWEL